MGARPAVALTAYVLASSSLLVTNKLVLRQFPSSSLLAVCQFCTTACFALILQKVSGTVDPIEWSRVRQHFLHSAVFSGAIYTNLRSLQATHVPKIVFIRSLSPLLVCLLESALGVGLPSHHTMVTLLALLFAAAGYAHCESEGQQLAHSGGGWLLLYWVLISLENVIGKSLADLSWRSMWGPVLYTNSMSILPMIVAGCAGGELSHESRFLLTTSRQGEMSVISLVALSCVVSVAISYFGWRCRQIFSATGFTVLGVANKSISILTSTFVFDQPLTTRGATCLVLCLGCAACYRSPVSSRSPDREKRS